MNKHVNNALAYIIVACLTALVVGATFKLLTLIF